MKVIILSNQTRSMAIFWRVLIAAMRQRNMEVLCCAPPGDEKSDSALKAMGARLIHYHLDRKGLNPLRDAASFWELKRIFQAEKPDMLFSSTIKPVIYGCMAAHWAKIPHIFATITGLGYAFEADTPLKKIINRISRLLYRQSLRQARGVFFQNRDDAALFQECGILDSDDNILFAAGTGVDTNWFQPAPFPASAGPSGLVFLLVGRLLEAKGPREYAKAAKMLKAQCPQARFQLLGPPERGRGAIDLELVRSWHAEGIIEYLGESRDVRPFIAQSHVAVLPSWREGVPTSLMEAMSMGRPCVATDVPGCRELVFEGQNGFLARRGDAASLAAAMGNFLRDPALLETMGAQSRRLAVEKFNAEKVAQGILDDMERMIAMSKQGGPQ